MRKSAKLDCKSLQKVQIGGSTNPNGGFQEPPNKLVQKSLIGPTNRRHKKAPKKHQICQKPKKPARGPQPRKRLEEAQKRHRKRSKSPEKAAEQIAAQERIRRGPAPRGPAAQCSPEKTHKPRRGLPRQGSEKARARKRFRSLEKGP